MKMVFQDTCKDLLEVFLALGRLKNKRTLYYDILARVTSEEIHSSLLDTVLIIVQR